MKTNSSHDDIASKFLKWPSCIGLSQNGCPISLTMDNGLLFHTTQTTSRSATRSHCTKQTNHYWTLDQMKMQWRNGWSV